MRRLEYILTVFAAILLTTSCSKDDLLPDGSTDAPVTGQTQTYTFTVSPDITMEGDARTRMFTHLQKAYQMGTVALPFLWNCH